jgi:hypothetical protein
MAQTSMLARMVALVGDAAIAWRRMQGATQSLGTAPTILVAKPQGAYPDAQNAPCARLAASTEPGGRVGLETAGPRRQALKFKMNVTPDRPRR